MSNYFGNVMPNNLANDIFGAANAAVAAVTNAITSNQNSSSQQQQQQQQQANIVQVNHDPQRSVLQHSLNGMNGNTNTSMLDHNSNLVNQQHINNQTSFDESSFQNRFNGYDRLQANLKTHLPNNTNNYSPLTGFNHSPLPQSHQQLTNLASSTQIGPNLVGINNGSNSNSSSSQFASLSSSSSPDYMNHPYKHANSNLLDANMGSMGHHAHAMHIQQQQHQQMNQQQQAQLQSHHLQNANGHLQSQLQQQMPAQPSPSAHMTPQQAFAASMQPNMPMNQMAPPNNFIYPWMRAATGNVKTSELNLLGFLLI